MAKKRLPEGTKLYRLTQAYYKLGRLYTPGEIITVKDGERISKTWVQVDEDGDDVVASTEEHEALPSPMLEVKAAQIEASKAASPEPVKPGKSLRPNDRTIG